jgi:benzoyl-CoA reductase/2-hydroxyglutaryl-CoA dehydratase subunit BcrC/BadD/HgdB
MDKRVGITTTIPMEILFAAGLVPCDLNNVFVTDPEPMRYVERAERDGFPKSMCNWIKGIYGVVMEHSIPRVITVMEGDCSNTQALAEILRHRGVTTIPFAFPFDRDKEVIGREIEKLCRTFGVDSAALKAVEGPIDRVRRVLARIDRMTWDERVVTGYENHLWLVRASDMLGDYGDYGRMADAFIKEAGSRPAAKGIKIGYIGVPPIVMDLYDFVEAQGGEVVFNETQRQFALPYFGKTMVERYYRYTYPYGIFVRLIDIRREVRRRGLKGIIHYVQAFCFRVMEDMILRDVLGIPVLTIEGELPRPLDTRTRLRLEAFLEMLHGREDGEG